VGGPRLRYYLTGGALRDAGSAAGAVRNACHQIHKDATFTSKIITSPGEKAQGNHSRSEWPIASPVN